MHGIALPYDVCYSPIFGLSMDTALSGLGFVQCFNVILSNCFVHVALAGGMPFSFISYANTQLYEKNENN